MRELAIIALVLWVLSAVVFHDWQKGVVYPPRSFAVRFTTAFAELTFVALAIWVIVDA